jgi:large subunit ribosomal protein L4
VATLKKYNLQGQEVGVVEVSEALSEADVNAQLVKDYIVAIRANARQWSASTKTRAEVKHTTKKCQKQKGTGNARHGSLVAPQYRGGGVVFGPRPKFDQHVKINKKEKKAAIRALIAGKIQSGRITLLDDITMEAPKTKTVVSFMKEREIKGRTLFIAEGLTQEFRVGEEMKAVSVRATGHANFARSTRNLPKTTFSLARNINGYELMCASDLVMTERALQEIQEWLC